MVLRVDKRLIYLFCFLLLAVWVQGCAKKATLTSTWVDHTFKGPIEGRLLVIGVFNDPTANNIFEDSFVSNLVNAGADAVPSYYYSKGKERHSKEWLHQTVEESGATFVLITHLNNEEKHTEIYKSHGVVLGGAMWGDNIDGYHSYVVEQILVPEETVTSTVAFIVATVFNYQANKAIWSASSKSVNLNNYLRADDTLLENLYIDDMKRDNLL